MLTCASLFLLVAVAGALRGVAVVARHRAESAADLAALAGAGQIGVGPDPCAAAAAIAARNATSLRSCTVSLGADGRSGTVVVRVVEHLVLPVVGTDEVMASARAGRLPAGPG